MDEVARERARQRAKRLNELVTRRELLAAIQKVADNAVNPHVAQALCDLYEALS